MKDGTEARPRAQYILRLRARFSPASPSRRVARGWETWPCAEAPAAFSPCRERAAGAHLHCAAHDRHDPRPALDHRPDDDGADAEERPDDPDRRPRGEAAHTEHGPRKEQRERDREQQHDQLRRACGVITTARAGQRSVTGPRTRITDAHAAKRNARSSAAGSRSLSSGGGGAAGASGRASRASVLAAFSSLLSYVGLFSSSSGAVGNANRLPAGAFIARVGTKSYASGRHRDTPTATSPPTPMLARFPASIS
jgi:hypothetical protein